MSDKGSKSKLNPLAQPFVPPALSQPTAPPSGPAAPPPPVLPRQLSSDRSGVFRPVPATTIRSSWDADPFPPAEVPYGPRGVSPFPPHQHLHQVQVRPQEMLHQPPRGFPVQHQFPQPPTTSLPPPQHHIQPQPLPPQQLQHRQGQFQPHHRPMDMLPPPQPPPFQTQSRPLGIMPQQYQQPVSQYHSPGGPPRPLPPHMTGGPDRRDDFRPHFHQVPPAPFPTDMPMQHQQSQPQHHQMMSQQGPQMPFQRPLPIQSQSILPTPMQPQQIPLQPQFEAQGLPMQGRPLPHMLGLPGMAPGTLPPQQPMDQQPLLQGNFGGARFPPQMHRPQPPGIPLQQPSQPGIPQIWNQPTGPPQPFPTTGGPAVGQPMPQMPSRVPLFRPDVPYPPPGGIAPLPVEAPLAPPPLPLLQPGGFEQGRMADGHPVPREEPVEYMAARLGWTESVRETEDWARQLTQGTSSTSRPTLEAQLATVAALENDTADADGLGQFVVLLIGPPASGKTTQANAICERYHFDLLDLGTDAANWPAAQLQEKVQLVWQTQRPGLVIENVPSLECARAIDDLCSRNGLSVGCVLMLEIDDMLKLAARARCRDKARGRREVVPTTELFGPIRDFMVLEQALLEHYRTFPALYRMDVNKPQSQVTGEILRILDTLHGHRAGTSALPRVMDETPLFKPEDCLDFIPDGPSQAINFLRSSIETRRIFNKLKEMLGSDKVPRTYPGRQPALFDEEAVRKVCLGELGSYVVSKKFDGLQGLLICLPNECYLVDHSMALYQLRPQLQPKVTTELLLDGDLMTTGSMGWFTVSDTLYADGQCLLAKPLPQRMTYAREHFAKEATMFSLPALGACVHLVCKAMAPLRDLRRMMGEVETAKHGLYECLTLTPLQHAYKCGPDPAVFKWKSLPTCDFRLVYNDMAPELHLCSGSADDIHEVLFYHIDTDFSNQQKIKRMVSKIVECLPLTTDGDGESPNVELAHQEWEIVRVRPSRTVPDHMDMVTATLRSHLTGDRLLELVEHYGKQKTGRRRAGLELNLQVELEPVPYVGDTSEVEVESVGEPEEQWSEDEEKQKSVEPPNGTISPLPSTFKPLSYAEAVSGRPAGPNSPEKEAEKTTVKVEPHEIQISDDEVEEELPRHEKGKGKGKGKGRPRGMRPERPRRRSDADWDSPYPPRWPGKGEKGKGKGKGEGRKGDRGDRDDRSDRSHEERSYMGRRRDRADSDDRLARDERDDWEEREERAGKGHAEGRSGKGYGGKGDKGGREDRYDDDMNRREIIDQPDMDMWGYRADRWKNERSKGDGGERSKGKGERGKGKGVRRGPTGRPARWSRKSEVVPAGHEDPPAAE